jgi:hypothetical protein
LRNELCFALVAACAHLVKVIFSAHYATIKEEKKLNQ